VHTPLLADRDPPTGAVIDSDVAETIAEDLIRLVAPGLKILARRSVRIPPPVPVIRVSDQRPG
jgi:hypothetical protein